MACNNNTLVKCTEDWNFGDQIAVCPTGCIAGACLQ
jgi:hypothetical protein